MFFWSKYTAKKTVNFLGSIAKILDKKCVSVFYYVVNNRNMAIRIKSKNQTLKPSSRLQNTYFKPSTLNSKRTKSRGNFRIQKFSDLLSIIILPSTLLLSTLSLLLIFLPGIFNIKTVAKAAPSKDSVRIITNYTYTTKPNLEKVTK